MSLSDIDLRFILASLNYLVNIPILFSFISFLLNIKINGSCLKHLEEDCTCKQRDIHIYIFIYIYYTHVNIYAPICIYTYANMYALICNTTYTYKAWMWSHYINGSKISHVALHPGPPFSQTCCTSMLVVLRVLYKVS